MECIILSVKEAYMDAQEVMHMTDYSKITALYPYHFCEWLRDCSGYKVYLILADFAGREYNTLV